MHLKILQWNVWYKENIENIAAEIKKINPDIVAGQEFIQHLHREPQIDTAQYLAQSLNYEYVYEPAETWSDRPTKENQGNALFSRFPITTSSVKSVQLAKHNPVDPEHEGRIYIEISISIEGKAITIGTTHLSYSDHFTVTDHRKKEVDALLTILKEKQTHYIFTGDLNSVPDSYTIKEISKLPHLQHTGPSFDEKTWTTKPFEFQGFKEDQLNWRLDYVFVSPDIKVISSKIVQTDFSDHLPILVEVEV